ncbi:hypothetical protein SH139x_002246 [Planctomycetaceae bacterium SH139]
MKKKLRKNDVFPKIIAIVMCTVAHFFPSGHVAAQAPPQEAGTTWQDLGLNLPKDYPTNDMPLFEGLNKARGSWTFVGESMDGEVSASLDGSLTITGGAQGFMLPMWRLVWRWPQDGTERALLDIIMAEPRKDGFNLSLTRIGPVENLDPDKPRPGVAPAFFQGSWDSETRTLTWIQGGTPRGLPIQAVETESSKLKQSFELVVAADGKVTIQNSKHLPGGHVVTAKGTDRTAEAPEEPRFLTGKHKFQSVDEIADLRIKPWLPQQATEISLFSETAGHFARYKVAKKDFEEFMDKLWKEQGDNSAHQRDSMSGEGGPAKRENMVRRFESLGWEPLENAIIFYSPSEPNGAMTTYYFDSEAGSVYHDRGYW